MLSERMTRNKKSHPIRILMMVFFTAAFFAAMAWVVMLLWNHILAAVTNVRQINFWQSAGILLLCKILFGFGFRRKHWKRMRSKNSYWKEKWMNMSEEERAAFKAKWKDRCGR